jgi:hypothetical protein
MIGRVQPQPAAPASSLPAEAASSSSSIEGRVVRGVAHVDLQLAVELASQEFKQLDYNRYSRCMLDAARQRAPVYDQWAVGQPYENVVYSAILVEARDLQLRTVYTITQSFRSIVWRLVTTALVLAGFVWINGVAVIPPQLLVSIPWLGKALVGLTSTLAAAVVAINGRHISRIYRHTFRQLPAGASLLDVGRALFAALQAAGLVSSRLDDDHVQVAEILAEGYEVFLDRASPEDSSTFSLAYQQVLGPIADARYLIERDSTTLRNPLYRPLWLLVRTLLGLGPDLTGYHRVPDVLATRRELADALARPWRHYVGGGQLVYTRTDEGRRVLLQARALPRRPIRQMAFDIWR